MQDKLHKNISLITAFSIAAGAMISSGLFVLPGVIYPKTGPSIIVVYFLAGILMIPTIFSQSELATAMPKAGGAYNYIMRILGAPTGMVAGFASWFSIAMKSAFALIGIGTFLTLINPTVPEFHIRLLAAGAAVLFTLINLLGTKYSGTLQTILVFILLAILTFFLIGGYPSIKASHYQNFFNTTRGAFFASIGMVFISFGGLTKIASMSEEIKKSGRNLPKAMFLAYFVMMAFYLLVIIVTVGILPHHELAHNLTPISTAASHFAGNIGIILMSFTAMLAFVTTANAGIMSASRVPLGMGRDGLIPDFFTKISTKNKTPYFSILATGFFITFIILALRIESLVKVASAMLLFLFILNNLSLIIIRNLDLRNYRPTFRAPLFPYLQMLAIVIYLILIYLIGAKILLMAIFAIIICLVWYYFYARNKKFSQSALILLAEKIANKDFTENIEHTNIEDELFELLQHREDIKEDRFDKTIKKGIALDIKEEMEREEFFELLSQKLTDTLEISQEKIYDAFTKREKDSSTNIAPKIAIPHIIVPGQNHFQIALARAKEGINWQEDKEPVKAVFVLIGTVDMRDHHLRALMAVSELVQNKEFFKKWMDADDTEDLKSIIRLMPRKRH